MTEDMQLPNALEGRVRTPQQEQGDREKQQVGHRIKAAMNSILSEVEEHLKTEGSRRYSQNGGRVNRSEVLRRAGGVDKNTLKKPYHADLLREVDRFVGRVVRMIDGRPESAREKNYKQKAQSQDDRIGELAQTNKALQRSLVRRKRECASLTATIGLLLKEKSTLEHELAEARGYIGVLREVMARGPSNVTVLDIPRKPR